jgi:hypothetical protein
MGTADVGFAMSHAKEPRLTREPFMLLERLSDSDDPRLITAADLRIFCHELELHGAYQILAWRREGNRGGQVEIVITYETPPNIGD